MVSCESTGDMAHPLGWFIEISGLEYQRAHGGAIRSTSEREESGVRNYLKPIGLDWQRLRSCAGCTRAIPRRPAQTPTPARPRSEIPTRALQGDRYHSALPLRGFTKDGELSHSRRDSLRSAQDDQPRGFARCRGTIRLCPGNRAIRSSQDYLQSGCTQVTSFTTLSEVQPRSWKYWRRRGLILLMRARATMSRHCSLCGLSGDACSIQPSVTIRRLCDALGSSPLFKGGRNGRPQVG